MQPHLHMKYTNSQEAIHALISYFFSSSGYEAKWSTWKQLSGQNCLGRQTAPLMPLNFHLQTWPTADVRYSEELNKTLLITALLFKVTRTGTRRLPTLQIKLFGNLQPAVSPAFWNHDSLCLSHPHLIPRPTASLLSSHLWGDANPLVKPVMLALNSYLTRLVTLRIKYFFTKAKTSFLPELLQVGPHHLWNSTAKRSMNWGSTKSNQI